MLPSWNGPVNWEYGSKRLVSLTPWIALRRPSSYTDPATHNSLIPPIKPFHGKDVNVAIMTCGCNVITIWRPFYIFDGEITMLEGGNDVEFVGEDENLDFRVKTAFSTFPWRLGSGNCVPSRHRNQQRPRTHSGANSMIGWQDRGIAGLS